MIRDLHSQHAIIASLICISNYSTLIFTNKLERKIFFNFWIKVVFSSSELNSAYLLAPSRVRETRVCDQNFC